MLFQNLRPFLPPHMVHCNSTTTSTKQHITSRSSGTLHFQLGEVALKRAFGFQGASWSWYTGDSFGALGYGMLGQLPLQQQAHDHLHLRRRDGGMLVVLRQAGGFTGKTLEHVVHLRVYDAGIRVHLLQHVVHVGGVALLVAAFALLDFLCLKCCPSLSLSSAPEPREKATVQENSHRRKVNQGRNGTHGTEGCASSAIYHLHIQMKAPNLYTLIGQPAERCWDHPPPRPRNLCH